MDVPIEPKPNFKINVPLYCMVQSKLRMDQSISFSKTSFIASQLPVKLDLLGTHQVFFKSMCKWQMYMTGFERELHVHVRAILEVFHVMH